MLDRPYCRMFLKEHKKLIDKWRSYLAKSHLMEGLSSCYAVFFLFFFGIFLFQSLGQLLVSNLSEADD